MLNYSVAELRYINKVKQVGVDIYYGTHEHYEEKKEL